MKKQYLSLLIFASLSCAANNEAFTSQFEGYIEGQETSSTPIQFAAIGSGFNYQGELLDSGTAVNVNFDFSFKLFDALIGGNQVGSNIIKGNRAVTGGIFSIEDIDFGNASYTGDALWLSVTVRETGNPGSETTLSPRQKIHAVPYAVQAEFAQTPWTENGSNVSYNGSAELTGTASVHNSNGGLSVGNTSGSHMTIDGDDIQRRINGSNDPGTMYLNFYGGDVRLASSTNKVVMNGDVQQPVSSNGIMKYMVYASCGSSPNIIRQYNGVSAAAITVSGTSVGRCIIDFPNDIDNRFWQVSINYAGSIPSISMRTANCRLETGFTDRLFCNVINAGNSTFTNGSIMVLIY